MSIETAETSRTTTAGGGARPRRRVLVVSYYFPPAGDVGIHRTLRFVKWLPHFGWEPIVLTTRNGKVQAIDRTMLDCVPEVEVHRTRSFELLNYGKGIDGRQPWRMPKLLSRLVCEPPRDLWKYLAVPDDKRGWVPYAVRAGAELIRSRGIDAVYVSGKPFSSYFIGERLGRRFGIPWIMDLRDLWTLNRRNRPRSRWRGWAERRLERRFVQSAAAVIANICMVAVSLLIVLKPFWGPRRPTPHEPHEAPLSMTLGPLLLAVLGLFVGLVPGVFDATIGTAMASVIRGQPLPMELKLLFGLNPEALMVVGISTAALGLGYLLYRWLWPGRVFGWPARVLGRVGPQRMYHGLVAGVLGFAARHTRIVQAGYLRWYLLVVVAVFAAAVGPIAFRSLDLSSGHLTDGAVHIHEAVLALVVMAGALYAVFASSRLASVAAIGGSGIGIAVLFAAFGAVDLAITQLMVESLMVILLVLVLWRMPRIERRSPMPARLRDALVALAAGTTVTLLVLAAGSVSRPADVSTYFLERSVPEGFGRNVVNVILVGFRALDTLGEIVVVAVAGVGVAALVWSGRPRRRARRPEGSEGAA